MKCRKCRAEIPDGSKFCMKCGVKQDVAHRPKSRGNGQGSVYQLPNKTWIAIKTIGYETGRDKKTKRITRSKSGFRTKKEALDYLPLLTGEKREKAVSLRALYEAWEPTHRAGKDTMNCYKAAWKYFAPISVMQVKDITLDDLQDCVDDCPHGKRTKQNMKTLCGLLYKYAIPRHLATLNMGEYLKVSGDSGVKDGLPVDALEAIGSAVETVPGADYVYCHCYLGFRPSELLALDVTDYDKTNQAFTGGAKTDAGKNRVVTVSPKIIKIIDGLTSGKDNGPVFCAQDGGRLSSDAYRSIFYNVLEKCKIENPVTEMGGVQRHKYTPHSCRHTFATLMKRADGADKDKLQLIGHTSMEMLRHYQDVSIEDLRKITDKL